ncbi:unnamed protein product [Albugo candida]|uniref:Uncharacterized protein n=1 Tax=Albugo candida TaxID=65357 RepID=A0A024GAC9_9STRA|nr:unnamed protein product [Albugo candida]|eukprot:CCI43723.1 unnamed protein product [Albugo candida]
MAFSGKFGEEKTKSISILLTLETRWHNLEAIVNSASFIPNTNYSAMKHTESLNLRSLHQVCLGSHVSMSKHEHYTHRVQQRRKKYATRYAVNLLVKTLQYPDAFYKSSYLYPSKLSPFCTYCCHEHWKHETDCASNALLNMKARLEDSQDGRHSLIVKKSRRETFDVQREKQDS